MGQWSHWLCTWDWTILSCILVLLAHASRVLCVGQVECKVAEPRNAAQGGGAPGGVGGFKSTGGYGGGGAAYQQAPTSMYYSRVSTTVWACEVGSIIIAFIVFLAECPCILSQSQSEAYSEWVLSAVFTGWFGTIVTRQYSHNDIHISEVEHCLVASLWLMLWDSGFVDQRFADIILNHKKGNNTCGLPGENTSPYVLWQL